MSLAPPQAFRKTAGIHRVGLSASRPAAADVLVGTLYYSTDTTALERSNGQTWDAYAATGSTPVLPPYVDLVEGTFQNPPADTERLYALDVNGYTQVEMKDSAGHGARLASDNILIAKITEPNGVTRGQIVYIAGATGANALVRLAKSDAIATMPTIGVVLDAGAVNAFTRVLTSGTLQGVNTAAFAEGVSLFVSPTTAGALTDVLPVAPAYAQRVGFVTRSHATQGELLVLTTGTVTDPRLHHATHEVGGSDQIQNAAWTNQPNVFTKTQTIEAFVPDDSRFVINNHTGEGAVLVLSDMTAPPDLRTFYFKSQGGGFYIQAVDANAAATGSIQIYRGEMTLRTPLTPQITMSDLSDHAPGYPRLIGGSGQMEFQRFDKTDRILVLAKGFGDTPLDASQLLSGTVPDTRLSANVPLVSTLGLWTDIAFNAANYTSDSGTFVVTTQYALHYTLTGKTLVYGFYLNGTVTGTPIALGIKLPAGLVATTYSGQVFNFGSTVGVILVTPSAGAIGLYVNSTGATPWTAGTYFMVGTITLQVN